MSAIYEKVEKEPDETVKSIKTLVKLIARTMQEQETVGFRKNDVLDDYELMLQRSEADIKKHIRVNIFHIDF